MAYTDRMKTARKEKGLTQEQLATMIGVGKSTYNGYEKGNSEPSMLTFAKIIQALDIDANYLFQDEMALRIAHSVSPAEMEHIKKYRGLDDRGKRIVDTVLGHEMERMKEIRRARVGRKNNMIPLSRSLQSFSAGTGVYLGPEEMETIYVQENELTRRASFCGAVSGDSMEPVYHDGDILLVEGCEDIPLGQIGVFSVNGDGYVKKRGNGELISLNPAYDSIPLTEDSWCNGLVIGVLDPEWMEEASVYG